MPVGPITPGSYTTVTPDSIVAAYASLQSPSPTMLTIAADIAALTLAILNVQKASVSGASGGFYSPTSTVTIAGSLVTFGGAGVQFSTGQLATNVPLVGDTTNLFLSQVGEDCHILADLVTVNGLSSGGASFSGGVLFNNTIQFTSTITPSGGTAHIRKRPASVGVTTNHTYTIADADTIVANPTAGDITYTISSSGAQPGDRMLVTALRATATANTVHVVDGTASSIADLRNTAGQPRWVLMEFSGISGQFFPVATG